MHTHELTNISKEEASAVLASMRLMISGAFHMLLTRVAKEYALSFELLIPNQKTIVAMEEARRSHSLMDNLNNEKN